MNRTVDIDYNYWRPLIVVVAIVAAMVCGIVADSTLNYPLGKYVTTTDEYNQTFGDSFSGYIVSKNPNIFTAEVTVRNDAGEERTLYVRWLNVRGNR